MEISIFSPLDSLFFYVNAIVVNDFAGILTYLGNCAYCKIILIFL